MSFFQTLMATVVGLVLLVAMLPLINDLVFTTINSNMSALGYSSIIVLLISMTGIFVAIAYVQSIFGQQNAPPQGY